MHNAPKFFRLRPEPGQGTLRRYFVVESLALVLDIGNEVRNQEAQGSEWFEDLFYKVSDIDIRQQQSEIRNQKSEIRRQGRELFEDIFFGIADSDIKCQQSEIGKRSSIGEDIHPTGTN
jgi:hypothetical protein